MRIVVLDGYTENPGDLSWDGFASLGELTVFDRTSYNPQDTDLIVERAKGAQAVIINKTPLTAQILDALSPELRYIGVLATGYNVVDVDYAAKKGITVCNIPSYGTTAVAQMTIALLLELCHHIGEHSRSVMNGDWSSNADWCYWKFPLVELLGKTIGIIGFGRIGQNVSHIASALGMKVLAFDEHPDTSLESDGVRYTTLDNLLQNSDVVSLHCPLFPSTQAMINSESISKMRDGAMLINTSRGGLIAEQDLADALNCGKLSGAALDVVSAEPIQKDNPLLTAQNCIITPHIAWAPKESRQRLMDIAVDNLASFINKDTKNIVKG